MLSRIGGGYSAGAACVIHILRCEPYNTVCVQDIRMQCEVSHTQNIIERV